VLRSLILTLLGVGAMNSPRYPPAGLLLQYAETTIVFDGGPDADPPDHLDAWLVCDEQAELRAALRRAGAVRGHSPRVASYSAGALRVAPLPVVHTNHPTFGYAIRADTRLVVWAPEFWQFPSWATGVDLMFADAAGWSRPIRFRGGVGGHASVHAVAAEATRHGVRRLVFAHIGRPSIRALDAGLVPPFGEWGVTGRRYQVGVRASR
jgi:hypothetical protein